MGKSIISCLFLAILACAAPLQLFAQAPEAAVEKPLPGIIFSCTLTTTDNLTYTLKNFTISRLEYFNCKLRDSVFKIPFEKLLSVTLIPTPEPPFKGYTQGTLAWASGGQVQVWVSTDNYRVEGTEEKLGIVLKIPLSEIRTIRITQEKLPVEKPVVTPAAPDAGQTPATTPSGETPSTGESPQGTASPSGDAANSTNYTFNWY